MNTTLDRPAAYSSAGPQPSRNGPHRDRVDGVVPGDHQSTLAIAQDQVAGLPHNPVAQLEEDTNRLLLADPRKARHSDCQFQCLDLFDPGFFRFHFKPQTDGFADVGESLIPRAALGVASRQINAAATGR